MSDSAENSALAPNLPRFDGDLETTRKPNPGSFKPGNPGGPGGPVGNKKARTHGLKDLRRRLVGAGLKRLDGRSPLAQLKRDWKAEIVAARGGDLSPQQATLLEVAANTWLLLSSADDWLLSQKSLVSKRQLLPVVLQRSALVRDLRGLLDDIGLSRAKGTGPTLAEIRSSYAQKRPESHASSDATDASSGDAIDAETASRRENDGP